MPTENLNNEPELLHRIAQGDEEAFQILYTHYWDRMYGNILHLCKKPELAEDLTQDLFINVWRNRSRLDEVDRFDAFLYKIARNLVLMTLRKKVFAHLDESTYDEYFVDDGLSGVDLLEIKEFETVVKSAIENLPPQMKRAFTLHRFQGMTHEQIAREMNISRLSSQTYVARAMVLLRDMLSKHKGEIGLLAWISLSL